MKDMVSCLSEHAVRVSEMTCPSYPHQSVPPNLNLNPSLHNAVVCVYKTFLLSLQKQQFLITVTWCRSQLGQGGFTISFGDEHHPSNTSSSTSFKLNTFSRLFRKKKGHKSIELESPSNNKIEVVWDLSLATYESSPEPIDGYYVIVMVGTELALALGDLAHDAVTKRLKMCQSMPKLAQLVCRREHYSGPPLYSTKAQFGGSGLSHEIVIRCCEDQEKLKQPVLYVSIDKKPVMKIRRLQWNFRGNQTVFVDGILVDLMWDVHDWFFNPASGHAVFMFKTRNGTDSPLWLEDKLGGHNIQQTTDFSLLIYASKNP